MSLGDCFDVQHQVTVGASA